MLSKTKRTSIALAGCLGYFFFNKVSNGALSFYISQNLIILIAFLAAASFLYINEGELTRRVQRLKHLTELVFLSKFLFIGSAIVLAIKYLEPLVSFAAQKFEYYGYLYRLYYKYFEGVFNIDKEAVVILVLSLAFLAVSMKRSLKENSSDVDKSEKKLAKTKSRGIIYLIRDFIYRNGALRSSLLLGTVISFIILGVMHLGQFMTVDEPKWFETRVPDFNQSILEEDWVGTYTNDKPGVITSIFSNAVNMFTDRTTYGHSDLQDYLFWWRLPLIILGALSLIPIYSLLKKLFNKNIAISTTVLLGLSPVVIGMSQVVNPDATLWSTAFLSFISFMLYIKTNKQKYVLLSGLFFGLGLLSKYFISIFYIFYFIIIYIEYLTGHKDPGTAVQRLVDLAKIVAISILAYAVFFPANWFDYRQIILGSLGSEIIRTGFPILVSMIGLLLGELLIFNGRISGWAAKRYDLGKIIVFSLTGAAVLAVVVLGMNAVMDYKYFDLNSFLWVEFQRRNSDIVKTLVGSLYTTFFVLTLPTLAGIGTALYMGVKEKLAQLEQLTLSSSFAIIVMFAGGAAIGGFVATGRYQIMLIPLYVLIAAIGIDKLKRENLWLIIVSLVSLVTVALSSPFYLNYQNSLASKGVVVNDPWGLGGYELANRMNKLPHAEDIRVWSDREGFNEFFVGKTYWRGKDNPFDPNLDIDYLILSRGGERIFRSALDKYENFGEGDIYSRLALQTPIMDYYEKEADFSFCLDKDGYNCIKAVKLIDTVEY